MADPTTAGTTTTTEAATTTTTATAAAPWHQGIEAGLLGQIQAKGWKLDEPKAAFETAAKAYFEAQKHLGVPPEKLLRMPEPSAPPADLDAFWQRLGVPKEAKEYDLANVKFADGTALDDGFVDAMRAGLHRARVPAAAAPEIARTVVSFMENADKEEQALLNGNIVKERETLEKSWGPPSGDRFKANMFVAENALKKLAEAIQMPPEQAKLAWDAISKLGGIGAASATNMLYEMGRRMGEDRYVSLGGTGTGNLPMTREAAQAEIQTLKQDKDWWTKYLNGDAANRARFRALHKIGYGDAAA